MQPDDPDGWIFTDDAYAGQIALREALIDTRREEVVALLPEGRAAADVLLDHALDLAARHDGFEVGAGAVRRPDGAAVAVDRADPLGTLGRLFQEDFCLLSGGAGPPVLTGAVLCFPAQWRLAEKIGRPLAGIHTPVRAYDGDVSARVERLFALLRPGRPLWRANLHFQDNPALFTPLSEAEPKTHAPPDAPYVRTERQVILRLPRTGAVVFSIHTQMIARTSLRPEEADALADWRGGEATSVSSSEST